MTDIATQSRDAIEFNVSAQAYINQIRGPEDFARQTDSADRARVLSQKLDIFAAAVEERCRPNKGQVEPSEPSENVKIARKLLNIAEEMEIHISPETMERYEYEYFKMEILNMGVKWGSILLVLHIGYRLCTSDTGKRMGQATLARISSHIKTLFDEKDVSGWIAEKGGWEKVKDVTVTAAPVDVTVTDVPVNVTVTALPVDETVPAVSVDVNVTPIISIGTQGTLKWFGLAGVVAVAVYVLVTKRERLFEIWNTTQTGSEETIIY